MDEPVPTEYWRRVKPQWHLMKRAACEHAVRKLIAVERTNTVIEALSDNSIDPGEKLEETTSLALLLQIAQRPSLAMPDWRMDGECGALIERLAGSTNIDSSRVEAARWLFTDVFSYGYHRGADPFFTALLTPPEDFVDFLELFERSPGQGEQSKKSPPQVAEEKAKLAEKRGDARASSNEFHQAILDHSGEWLFDPDKHESFHVDGCFNWVRQVRMLAASKRRLELADLMIGHLLKHAPQQNSALWPYGVIERILEETRSQEIGRGFQIAVLHNRPQIARRGHAGGSAEWGEAEEYRARAEDYRRIFPRVAALLEEIAVVYEEEATREDEDIRYIVQ